MVPSWSFCMVLRSLGGSQAQCSRGLLVCPLGIVLPLMELGHTLQGTPQRAGVAWLLGQRHGASFHCSQRYSVGYNTIPGMSKPPVRILACDRCKRLGDGLLQDLMRRI
jgi:hypothetical protein